MKSRYLLAIFMIPWCVLNTDAQKKISPQNIPDSLKIQTTLQRSAYFLHKRGESKSNLDSALKLADLASALSGQVIYNKGSDEAAFLKGGVYIKGHQNSKVKELIDVSDKVLQVRVMLEMIKYNTAFEGSPESILDTMLTYANRALKISDSLHSEELHSMTFLQLANIYYYKRDYLNGRRFFEQALKMAERSSYVEGQGEILSQMSTYIKLTQDPSLLEEIQKCREHLITSYQRVKDPIGRNKIHELLILGHDQLSYHYLYKGNLSQALDYSLDMVKLMEKEGNPFFSEVPYQTIGKIYFELGKMEQSIEYHKIARSIVFAKGEIIDGSALKNITKAYISLNRPKEGLAFLEETVARGGYDDVRNKKLIAESRGNCYFAMNDFLKAEKYYLESLEGGKKLGKEQLLVSYFPLGRLYIRTKQYTKAKFYLNQLVIPRSETVPLFVKRDAHLMLYQADSAGGDLAAAIAHLKRHKALNDSIFNEKQNGKIETLRLKYETDKKDRDLLLRQQEIQLLTKKGELKEAELHRTRWTRNVLIGGAVILFIILSMLYNRYLFKLKTNHLLQVKQDKINESNHTLIKLNNDLHKLLGEKEWLVKEIHHRVKNNLQFVVSLLNTHAAHLKEDAAREAIRESQARMQVISLLHQKLYKLDSTSVVNMKAYIPELVTFIRESCKDISHVYFDLRIDRILLDVSQAVPVGLILNEAVTNSLKYAFKKNETGIVSISFEERDGEQLVLTITDDGIGMPDDFDLINSNSLGMRLMKMLSEQLDGQISIEYQQGVTIKVRFQKLGLGDVQKIETIFESNIT